jgi:WXG100 family type VII secretion target
MPLEPLEHLEAEEGQRPVLVSTAASYVGTTGEATHEIGYMHEDWRPDGSWVTVRPDGQTVQTMGDHSTLYALDGQPVKMWTGGAEDQASFYTYYEDGSYDVTDANGTVASYDSLGHAWHQVVADGSSVDFGPDGSSVWTRENGQTLLGRDGSSVMSHRSPANADHALPRESTVDPQAASRATPVEPHASPGLDGWSGQSWRRGHHGHDSFHVDDAAGSFGMTGAGGAGTGADRTVAPAASHHPWPAANQPHASSGPDGWSGQSWRSGHRGHDSFHLDHAAGSFGVNGSDGAGTVEHLSGSPQQAALAGPPSVDFTGAHQTAAPADSHHPWPAADQRPMRSWAGHEPEGGAAHPGGQVGNGDGTGIASAFASPHQAPHEPPPDTGTGSVGRSSPMAGDGFGSPANAGAGTGSGNGTPIYNWVPGSNKDVAAPTDTTTPAWSSGSVPRSPNQSTDSIRQVGDPTISAPSAGSGGTPINAWVPAPAADVAAPVQPTTRYQQTMPAQVQPADKAGTLLPGQWSTERGRSEAVPAGAPMFGPSAAVPAGAPMSGRSAMFPAGAPMTATQPDGTVGTYGQSGNPIWGTTPDGTKVSYNDADLPTNGVTTDGSRLTYDSSGQPASATKPDGATISYANGQPVSEVDPDGTKITFENGQPASATKPDGTTATYYPNGNPQSVTKDGVTTNYDNSGYVSSVTGPDGTQNYSYGQGGTITVSDPNGTSTTYDQNGHRLKTTTTGSDGNPLTIDWSVDLPAMLAAANSVKSYHGNLVDQHSSLKNTFNRVAADWQAPSGESFQSLMDGFDKVVQSLLELVGDSARRLHASYDNYMATENINVKNLTPSR